MSPKIAKRLFIPVALLVLAACLAAWFALRDNFHTVAEGLVYRSAQPSPAGFASYAREYGIRSVLNLRGRMPDSHWYKEELAATRALGLAHFDHKLSAMREVDPAELDEILSVIARAPKPILIHCQGGADRTGLVCAVWELTAGRLSPAEAGEELSLWYGHFPYLWSHTDAMDKSFWRYTRLDGWKRPPRPNDRHAAGERQGRGLDARHPVAPEVGRIGELAFLARDRGIGQPASAPRPAAGHAVRTTRQDYETVILDEYPGKLRLLASVASWS